MSKHTKRFSEFYAVFVSKLDPHDRPIRAYIEAERWHIGEYGKFRYSCWHSFRSACYNNRKRKTSNKKI